MEDLDTDTQSPPLNAGPLVIGMGASAGGLEALQSFFANMPSNSGAAFVVVQHLSPDYKSLMAEILGKYTGMTVIQAEEGMAVEPDAVYLIPPKHNLTFRNGRLFLMPHVHSGLNHPIDIFFESLATEMKERAVAVIFSGTGSDGTNGTTITPGAWNIHRLLEAAEGLPVSVYDEGGRLAFSGTATGGTLYIPAAKGHIYIIKVGGKTLKVAM